MRKKKLTPYLACAICEGFCEGEGASYEEQLRAWQYLIDRGLCWTLQGWYGRTASKLISHGLCQPAKSQARSGSEWYAVNINKMTWTPGKLKRRRRDAKPGL